MPDATLYRPKSKGIAEHAGRANKRIEALAFPKARMILGGVRRKNGTTFFQEGGLLASIALLVGVEFGDGVFYVRGRIAILDDTASWLSPRNYQRLN